MVKKSWRDTYTGGYLKAADLPREGKRVTITDIEERIIRKGENPKLIAELKELELAWVLNSTNCELLEELFGSGDPDDWRGKVELFNDRSVRGPNGEKGGIRVRPAASSAKKGGKANKDESSDDDEDLDDLDDEDDEDD